MTGPHSAGFSIIGQQMTFVMEALKVARYNAAQAVSSGNLELLQLAVSQLHDLAYLEQIPLPSTKPPRSGVRMDQFRSNMWYFNDLSNYLSQELGKKWVTLRQKYGQQVFGVGKVAGGSKTTSASSVQPKKLKWMEAQDEKRAGGSS